MLNKKVISIVNYCVRTIVSGTKKINKSSQAKNNVGRSDIEAENLKYLRNWLGNVGGDRYLNQVAQGNITGNTNIKLATLSPPSSLSSLSSNINYNTFMMPLLKVTCEKSSNFNDIKTSIDKQIYELKNHSNSFILDSSQIHDDCDKELVQEILEYVKMINNNETKVIGITNVSSVLQPMVISSGLSIISLSQNLMANKEVKTMKIEDKPKILSRQIPNKPSMIHYGAVRSGQQIYAEGSSLVVIGSVNSGGEVLADGDIHVYGNLKGRAVAGLGGSYEASIFAQKFEPSMIGIVDAFAIIDDFAVLNEVIGKGVCVKFIKEGTQKQEGSIILNCGSGTNDQKLLVSLLHSSL